MPLRSGSVGAAKLLPWLANLLPETHLAEIGQRLKVSPQDIVGLLGHIGRDTAGALSIGEPRKAGVNLQPVPSEQALERIFDELPAKPFLVGERGVSMSLAGVQEKPPVFVDGNGRISVPVEGTPSTHVLKPDTKRLAGSVENEAFCLSLARVCGLEAAEATIGVAGKRRYLLVKRLDMAGVSLPRRCWGQMPGRNIGDGRKKPKLYRAALFTVLSLVCDWSGPDVLG